MPKAKKKIPWAKSRAKEQLYQDIVAGLVTKEMKPRFVFAMHPELYEEYKKGFGSNYRNLQKLIGEEQERANQDSNYIMHDLAFHSPDQFDGRGRPRWCGSEAERLLMEDIKEGHHKTMAPAVLLQSRPEYAPWLHHGDVFRDHIHQITRSLRGRNYWLSRKKNKN